MTHSAVPTPRLSAVGAAGLLALGIVLLTLAFAPVWQFYLAWVGLVPWLLALRRMRSQAAAFFWSWLAGTLFFTANMWWMYAINVWGMLGLMVYCGIYWGFAALVIRGAGLLETDRAAVLPRGASAAVASGVSVLLIAVVWTASEWLRGNVMTGLPWLFVGHTQSPFLPMCQVADTLGAYGVTFWVVLVNALLALFLIRRDVKTLLPAGAMVLLVIVVFFSYGLWRMGQATTSPGPVVLVVQANEPQKNNGEKGATEEDRVQFHVETTRADIAKAGPGGVNLAVWSETQMPPLNHKTFDDLERFGAQIKGYLAFLAEAKRSIASIAAEDHIGILTGGGYVETWEKVTREGHTYLSPRGTRNTAYLFQPDGTMSDGVGQRYDKIHLVPWGEFIPFKYSIPILYRLFLAMGPKYYSDYELHDGTDNGLTVFRLRDSAGAERWRFVTPICFEDIDSRICAAMFRPGPDGAKRADVIVNITNDGWFAANENIQHLQAAVFRSIENRAPSARSVNTGVSGFIDSVGRTSKLLPARTAGTSVARLNLDARLTLYTRYGDVFAWSCIVASGATALVAFARRRKREGAKE